MIFVSDHDEDCYFSYSIDSCTDCLDCLNCFKCTLCLECIDCSDSYNLSHCDNTHNSSDSSLLSDCKGCKNCIACFGLRSKSFCIFNKQYKEDEYKQKVKELKLHSYEEFNKLKAQFNEEMKKKKICQYYDGNKNTNVTGDHIVNCKNCMNCFDSGELEDCGNLIFSYKSKDCFDGHVVVDKCELCLETISTINQYNTQFTFCSWYSKDSMYLDHCVSCTNCFACSGLKKEEYCIFNKKYSKKEYFDLRNKIIEHMKKTPLSQGYARQSAEWPAIRSSERSVEWGVAPPISLSPFGYNETVSQEYFPLTKEQALEKGYKWYNDDSENYGYTGPQTELEDSLENESEEILDKILICKTSKRPYKIIPQELKLYKQHNLPLPRKCFEERHMERIKRRNPRELWERKCMKCEKNVMSTYAPDRPEIIYCEDCYLQNIS